MPGSRTLVIGALALCAWSGWVSGFHTDSAAAVATWCVSLALVVGLDLALWSRRHRRDAAGCGLSRAEPWPRPGAGGAGRALHGLSPWLILIAVAAVWDVLGIDTGPHQAHLTISALAQAFRPVHATLLFLWLLVGIGYALARARAPRTMPPAAPSAPQVLAGVFVPLHGRSTTPALLLPANRPAGLLFWAAVCIAGIVVDQKARRSQGVFATAGDVVRFLSTSLPVRFLLIAAWVFAGYHLFAR